MEKIITVNTRKDLYAWADRMFDSFLDEFTDKTKARSTLLGYADKVLRNIPLSVERLPALLSEYVRYVSEVYTNKAKNKIIITIMNPKTGAFGKAVCCKEDMKNFNAVYGFALAWARLKHQPIYVFDDKVDIREVREGQHFYWRGHEYVLVQRKGAQYSTYVIDTNMVHHFNISTIYDDRQVKIL